MAAPRAGEREDHVCMSRHDHLGAATPSGIGEVLVSCRSFDEYRAMFALTDQDLGRALLDCPGGAAGFTAAAAATAARVQACDPLYDSAPDELLARATADRGRAERYVREHPGEYEWTFFEGLADYRARRGSALAAFARDYRTHRDRYVAASLPTLPFGDDAFDLVLSSHLLFAFADRLDLDFHRAAITEMTRVAAHGVRIFPVFAMGSGPRLDLEPLRTQLAADGIATQLVGVDYQFQRGEPVMLVCGG
jgi:hypothetical protein